TPRATSAALAPTTEVRMSPWRLILACILAAGLAPTPSRAQSSFYNWEMPPVHPVDMTPDGTRLLVTNTADARLEVFTLGGSLPVHALSIPVGLDPVSVRARP